MLLKKIVQDRLESKFRRSEQNRKCPRRNRLIDFKKKKFFCNDDGLK